MAGRKARPSTGSGRTEIGKRPVRLRSGQARIIPNKNRRLQVAPTRRKLFTRKAKDEFLEWFGATCNASLSARKVGFDYRTVFRHRREDAVFGAEWEEVLRLGYGRLEELALRSAEAALRPRRRRPSTSLRTGVKGPSTSLRTGEIVGMTPQDALQLLREHKRGLAGPSPAFAGAGFGSGQGRKPGRAPGVASTGEVFEALVKRLKAFQVRVRVEDAGGDGLPAAPSTVRSADGPPPRPGEDIEDKAA